MSEVNFMKQLKRAVSTGTEYEFMSAVFSISSHVPLNETPIINFRNYRYKIVELFVMSYKQEKTVLDAEIASTDILTLIGSYAEYVLKVRRGCTLSDLNDFVKEESHSWSKLLLLSHGRVRVLVNFAFAIMHLFKGDLIGLSDDEIVYCYILAACVISSIPPKTLSKIDGEIRKEGLKRGQLSISGRSKSLFSGPKPAKESKKLERAYVDRVYSILSRSHSKSSLSLEYQYSNDSSYSLNTLTTLTSHSNTELFYESVRKMSVRKSVLHSLSEYNKDLPQLGRLLHLGNPEAETEQRQLQDYFGQDEIALPATYLGVQRYVKPRLAKW